jgi:hypothetical protein
MYPASNYELFEKESDQSKTCSISQPIEPFDPRCRAWYGGVTSPTDASSFISDPYLSRNPPVMTSAVASPIRDDQGKQIGTVAITLNMEGLNILHSPYINLPDKFFYFVITGKMDVVWHS